MEKLSLAATSLLCLAALAAFGVQAQQPAKPPAAFTAISPIFSQLVMFSLPSNFTTVFEKPTPTTYIREAVLKGETVEKWTEMITVTGAKGQPRAPQASAQSFAAGIAAGFKRACPQTFAVAPIGPLTIAGHDGYAAVAGCGRIGEGKAAHSETALIVAIKGADDIYTIQWAERRAASVQPSGIDEAAWKDRLAKLGPIRLCAIVPGERAPYPSCVAGR